MGLFLSGVTDNVLILVVLAGAGVGVGDGEGDIDGEVELFRILLLFVLYFLKGLSH